MRFDLCLSWLMAGGMLEGPYIASFISDVKRFVSQSRQALCPMQT
jgi:hypothetical protein